MGLLIFVALKPSIGNHEYVNPEVVASPICRPLALEVQVFVKSPPALAVTAAEAVTVVNLVDVQFKASVIVTVYFPAPKPVRSWLVD